jgi:hypothetical protein
MNLVTDCAETSAPSASGRWCNGVAKVLSTPTTAAGFRGAAQNCSSSATTSNGLDGDPNQITESRQASIQAAVSATAIRRTLHRARRCPALASPATP